MNIVIAPDSFKGSLTSLEVCRIIQRSIEGEAEGVSIVSVPMADGGEGTVDAIVAAAGGRLIQVNVSGPLGNRIEAVIGVVPHGDEVVAVLETAAMCGLTLIPVEARNPLRTTTRGLGEAVRAALDLGYRRFVIGLGGSATNDGGMGMLTALGGTFYDSEGQRLEGFGRDLPLVVSVDFSGLDARLSACDITIASDVTNPLLGPQGASHVFGPQKGATPEQVSQLDSSLSSYAQLVESSLRHRGNGEQDAPSALNAPGGGAAGGLGFALIMLGGRLCSGARVVGQLAGLPAKIAAADWVLTGEGQSDGQTLLGKLPMYVSQQAAAAGKPVVLISGSLGLGSEALHEHFTGCFATVQAPASLEVCIRDTTRNLSQVTRSVMRLIRRTKPIPPVNSHTSNEIPANAAADATATAATNDLFKGGQFI
jgi:glycerate kinase